MSLGALIGGLAAIAALAGVGRPRTTEHRSGPRSLPRTAGIGIVRSDEIVVRLGRWRRVGVGRGSSLLVVGPTQSGKTRRVVAENLRRHPGTVLVTSVKGDVLDARALERRHDLGDVWVLGDTPRATHEWQPWFEAIDDTHALAMADRLLAMVPERRTPSAEVRFWHELARPYVAAWLRLAWYGEQVPVGELLVRAAEVAGDELRAALDETVADGRQRDSLHVTIQAALGAARGPRSRGWPVRLGEALAPTVVVVGSLAEQERRSAWYATLLDTAFEAILRQPANTLVLLDEVAHLAPVPRLAHVAAVSVGLGARLVTIAQDFAQLEAAFGVEAASLVANHRARLFLDPAHDPGVRAHLAALGLRGDEGAILLGPRGARRPILGSVA